MAIEFAKKCRHCLLKTVNNVYWLLYHLSMQRESGHYSDYCFVLFQKCSTHLMQQYTHPMQHSGTLYTTNTAYYRPQATPTTTNNHPHRPPRPVVSNQSYTNVSSFFNEFLLVFVHVCVIVFIFYQIEKV